MAEIAGYVGAIYKETVFIRAKTIAFVDSNPDTITDSGSGFGSFSNGDEITVYNSSSNDGDYTVNTAAAGTLTLDAGDTLTAESAGARTRWRRSGAVPAPRPPRTTAGRPRAR